MYHLLIERVSTVTIEFLQYRARVRIGLNRAGIERAVERTGLFISLPVTLCLRRLHEIPIQSQKFVVVDQFSAKTVWFGLEVSLDLKAMRADWSVKLVEDWTN
jgi:hypothetical protein